MIGISLTAKQARAITQVTASVSSEDTLWIFSYFEHIDIETENSKSLVTTSRTRIREDGTVIALPLQDES